MSLAPTEGVGKPAPPDEPLAVDTVEASRLLGLSERKTWSLAVSGEIPSFKVGRARRYSVAALRRWIAEREGGAA